MDSQVKLIKAEEAKEDKGHLAVPSGDAARSTAFTSGKWEVLTADRGYIITANDRCYDIAVVRNIGNENNAANAHLIAAAPDLYAALQSFVFEFGDKTNSATVNKARAALSKARGEGQQQ